MRTAPGSIRTRPRPRGSSPDKIPRVFTGLEDWPHRTNLCCWVCDCTFDDRPKFVPTYGREGENGGIEFGVKGNICHLQLRRALDRVRPHPRQHGVPLAHPGQPLPRLLPLHRPPDRPDQARAEQDTPAPVWRRVGRRHLLGGDAKARPGGRPARPHPGLRRPRARPREAGPVDAARPLGRRCSPRPAGPRGRGRAPGLEGERGRGHCQPAERLGRLRPHPRAEPRLSAERGGFGPRRLGRAPGPGPRRGRSRPDRQRSGSG